MRVIFSEVKGFLTRLQSPDSFVRNFVVTFSGNSIAVLIGFLFTPIIARIYDPEAYGGFAVFNVIAQNISLMATFQLTRAFVLPQSEKEFDELFHATSVTAIITFIISLLVVLLAKENIIEVLNLAEAAHFIYLLPFSILAFAFNDIYKSWNVRNKFFQRNAANQIISSFMARSITVVYGVLINGHLPGLILGDFISKVIENIHLGLKGAGRKFKTIPTSSVSINSYTSVLDRYKRYPLYILPGIWILTFANQMPILFLAILFNTADAGHFSFANSLLNLPVNILAGAIAPVFLQKAAKTHRDNPDDLPRIVKELSNKLFFTGVFPILILAVYGDYIFKFFLGDQWLISGKFAGYMGVYFLFQIINNPLVSLYRIYNKEHVGLLTSSLLVLLNLVALLIGYYFNDVYLAIGLFSLGNILYCMLNTSLIFNLINVDVKTFLLKWLITALMAYGVLKGVRTLIEF